MPKFLLLALALCYFSASASLGQDISGKTIPPVLHEWKDWSLWGNQVQLDQVQNEKDAQARIDFAFNQ